MSLRRALRFEGSGQVTTELCEIAIRAWLIQRLPTAAVDEASRCAATRIGTDLLFEKRELVVVYTTTTNAGIITISDVFWLPLKQIHVRALDRSILARDAELPDMVKLGLSHYPRAPESCF